MPKIIDHKKNIGKKYGRLTVIDVVKKDKYYYLCRCECGEEKEILARSVIGGQTKTCGKVSCISESRIEHAREMGRNTRKHAEICDNCGRCEHYAKGYCRNCYTRLMRKRKGEE